LIASSQTFLSQLLTPFSFFSLMATPESASVGLADSQPEVEGHGSSTLATVLPLLISPALAKFASGVEAVVKSQVSWMFAAVSTLICIGS
jgi:hypothetical protein